MGQYLGMVQLGSVLTSSLLVRNTSNTPINADAAPSYRIYGAGSVLASGTLSAKHTGTITGATNAAPIAITSTAHGLTTGTRVTITGVGTNTAANGTFVVTVTGANTFTLDGGTFNVSGLYAFSITASGGNGYAVGNYSVVVNYAVSGTTMGEVHNFTVV